MTAESFTHLLVFLERQAWPAPDQRHTAAESPHRLRKLYSHIPAANHHQMFVDAVEFQRLDVRQGLRLSEAWNGIERGSRARTDDHLCPAQPTYGLVAECDFQSPGSYESPGSQNELRACFLAIRVGSAFRKNRRIVFITQTSPRNAAFAGLGGKFQEVERSRVSVPGQGCVLSFTLRPPP